MQNVMAQVDGLFGEYRPPERQWKEKGRRPALLEYISGPMKLRAFFKGKKLAASIRRNGTIRFTGEIFTSPSFAAAVAVKRKTCNGWTFWEYERAPGDWVKLNNLRK